MVAREHADLEVRPTTRADVPAIVALAARSLGWAGDQRDHDFFVWKHFENPFGASRGWAAFDGDRMVAFRTMMRWRFARGGETLEMVRAVDTATDPDHQGRGLFRRLTTRAVEELAADGIDAVFNTPNEQSRPGYLKMGWEVLGRPTIWVSPRSPLALARMARARTGAEKWSEPVDVGRAAAATDAADWAVGGPATGAGASGGWATDRSVDHLRWRYGFAPLHYRLVEVDGGAAVVRLRTRGALRELVVADWLSTERDPRAIRSLLRTTGADYALGLGLSVRGHAAVPLPGQGPVVTWRQLARPTTPELSALTLSLGDLELF